MKPTFFSRPAVSFTFQALPSLRRKCLFFIVALALLAWTQLTQARIPIERAQRDFQSRYTFVATNFYGNNASVSWPPCWSCGEHPAPALPKDGFYGDLTEAPDQAVKLVRDLAGKVLGQHSWSIWVTSPLYSHFVVTTNGIDGVEGVASIPFFAESDFPFDLNDINSTNYPQPFQLLQSYIQRLQWVQWGADQVHQDYRRVASSNNNCGVARGDAETAYAGQGWRNYTNTYEAPYLGAHEHLWYKNGGYRAELSAGRGRLHSDLRPLRGTGLLYAKAVGDQDGIAHEPAGIYGDGSFHLLVSNLPGENDFLSALLGDLPSLSFTAECQDTPSVNWDFKLGWTITDQTVIFQPDFASEADLVDCGGDCPADCGPGGLTTRLGSAHARINLGPKNRGNSGGYLYFQAAQPSAWLYTPAALRYSLGTDVVLWTSADGATELHTGNLQATIRANSALSYSVWFTNGTTTPSFIASVTVAAEGGNTNQMLITAVSGPDATAQHTRFLYNAGANQWAMETGEGFRKEARFSTWTTTSNRTDTTVIKNAAGATLHQRVEKYTRFPWGLEQVEQVLGTGSTAETNRWQFYSTPGDVNYSQLARWLGPGGRWERFQYDVYGRLTNRVTQFGNTTGTSTASANRMTEIQYASNMVITTEWLLGQRVARTYAICSWDAAGNELETRTVRCANPNGGLGDSGNLTNLFVRTSSTLQPLRSQRPDGTLSIQRGDLQTVGYSEVLEGQPDAAGTSIAEGTYTYTTTGNWGEKLYQETRTVSADGNRNWTLIEAATFNYLDELGRSHTVIGLDARPRTVLYDCCGLTSETDADGVPTTYLLDPLRHRIGSVREGITVTNTLDAAGQLVSRHRRGSNGQLVRLWSATNDLAGRVLAETNALLGVTQHAYSYPAGGGLVHTITYPDNGQRVETFHGDGTLQSITGSATSPTYYNYGADASGAWTQATKGSANGTEWVKTYTDALGNAYLTVYPGNATNRLWFNTHGQLWKQRDPDGVTTLFHYNAKGELTTNTLDLTADSLPNRVRRTEADVFTTADVWNGSVVHRQRTWELADNGNEALVSEHWASANGLHTANIAFGLTNWAEVVYASGGVRYVTNTAPDQAFTVTVFTNGRTASVTAYDANASQLGSTAFAYDAHGRQYQTIDTRNGATTYGYTNSDQVTSVTTPAPGDGSGAQATVVWYDRSLRATNTLYPDNTSAYARYDSRGLPTLVWGSRTTPATYGYDDAGRLKTMTNWSNFATGAGARVTTWQRDPYRGFVTNKLYAGNTPGPSYTYTLAGRLKKQSSARGITTTYGQNAAGELASVSYNDGATAPLTASYNRRGRPATVTQGTITTTLAFNDAGQLLAESYSGGPLTGLAVTNGYDIFLRRTTASLFNSPFSFIASTAYTYDDASRLSQVTDGSHSATYNYLVNSPLLETTTFKQSATTRLATTRAHDHLNRLTLIQSLNPQLSTLNFSAYRYNTANQRTALTNADSSRWEFGYDALGQLTSGKRLWGNGAPVAGQQFEYEFDDIGNRQLTRFGGDTNGLSLRQADYYPNLLNQYRSNTVPQYAHLSGRAVSNATVTVNYLRAERQADYWWGEVPINTSTGAVWLSLTNLAVLNNGTNKDIVATNLGHLFVPKTPASLGYDADGNLTNDGRFLYAWDAGNRVKSFERVASAPAASKVRVACQYDVFWRRTEKVVSTWTNNAYVARSTNRFVYAGWNLAAILNATNGLDRSFTWGLDLSGTIQGAGGVSGLVSMTVHHGTGTGTYFYCYDGNGNVAALVNATDGTVTARYEYGPFGELLRATGPLARLNPYLFSTKFYDWETGYYYYGYRYYDPIAGRWLSRDPLGERGGANLYNFVGNQPVSRFDPVGLLDMHAWIPPGLAGEKPPKLEDYSLAPMSEALDRVVIEIEVCYDDIVSEHELLKQLQQIKLLGNASGLLRTPTFDQFRGTYDLLRFGEGMAEGGLNGWGNDLRRGGEIVLVFTAVKCKCPSRLGPTEVPPLLPERFVAAKSTPTVFRQGTFADPATDWKGNYVKGQQWATDNPLTTPNYAQKYGLPAQNTAKPDWVVGGRVQGPYTTRPAPPSHNNPLNTGGATEVLPGNPNNVRLDWFHMPD